VKALNNIHAVIADYYSDPIYPVGSEYGIFGHGPFSECHGVFSEADAR
jgi:hypothetical protein